MSVVVTGYDQSAMRVGVFYRPEGVRATPARWPFGRFTFGAVGCSLTGMSTSSASRKMFAWTDVVGAESTRFGVRFRLADVADSVEIGTLRQAERAHLLDAARTYCPAGTFEDHPVVDVPRGTRSEPSVWMRAIRVPRSLAGKTRKTRRRQPKQT